jgi:hypothetical protein
MGGVLNVIVHGCSGCDMAHIVMLSTSVQAAGNAP